MAMIFIPLDVHLSLFSRLLRLSISYETMNLDHQLLLQIFQLKLRYILEVDSVLRLIDANIEVLDVLIKVINFY